eukprot:m.232102 g.232102  ORF g.232102 m.232102 type:complete len:1323 (+) comp12300_c0_seq1:20-3988(+)
MPAAGVRCESIWKATQRQVYNFLSSRHGLTICIAGLFITLISAFQFGEMAVEWSRQKYELRFNTMFDNIGGRSFQDRLCLPQPIDIVYTWVNGSDPLLLQNLAALKLRMEIERNMTEEAKRTEANLRHLLELQERNNTNATATTTHAPTTTTPLATTTTRFVHKSIWSFVNRYALGVLGLHTMNDESKAVAIHMALEDACGYVEAVDIEAGELGGLVHFSRKESVTSCLNKTLPIGGGNLTLVAAYLLGNTTLDGVVPAPRGLGFDGQALFALGAFKTAFLSHVPAALPTNYLRKILEVFGTITSLDRWDPEGIVAVTFTDRFSLIDLMDAHDITVMQTGQSWQRAARPSQSSTTTPTAPPTTTANTHGRMGFVRHLLSLSNPDAMAAAATETYYTLPVVAVAEAVVLPHVDASTLEHDEDLLGGGADNHAHGSKKEDEHLAHESDEVSSSRFQDNSELQYSLRSLEKHAPWVRHIYIVTNGQIPAWLNLDHPRISVVPHDDIFLNKSHLPTFSSPSIETHLHRIPGLSKKFLYLNDDVLFGTEVWPDDFYTHAKGQKIFLAWPVPNCEEGCPSNWIGDKYCDVACNTTACDYDGGDCLGKANTRETYHGWSSSSYTATSQYCNQGCADSWMGDKYCDRACDVPQCGFDGGDCGIDKVTGAFPGIPVSPDQHVVHQDVAVDGVYPRVVYLNMSQIFGNITVKEANFEGPDVLHAGVISQTQKVVVLVFRENLNATSGRLVFTTNAAGPMATYALNITVNTTKAAVSADGTTTTAAPHVVVAHNASTNSTTNTSTPLRVVSGSTINHWEVVNETTATPRTYATHSMYTAPVVTNETLATLPARVQHALAALEKEYADGFVTQKGYNREKYLLLQPYLALHNTSSPSTSQTSRRRLLSLRDMFDAPDATAQAAQPLGGYVIRGGVRVRADEAELADWIANSKSKQISFERDMKDSIAAWELATGKIWMNDTVPDHAASSFPWERLGIFRHLEGDFPTPAWKPRHLLDTFGDSLKFVNKLYNKAFGYTARRVIAHMPHMLDRDILAELEARFWHEWDATSSHSLRSGNDMQYAFAYFYYLVGQARPFNVSEQFSRLDTDGDGVLSVNELRTLITRIYDIPTSFESWHEFENILLNCSDLQPPLEQLGVGVGPHSKEVWVTEKLLANCTRLLEKMQKLAGKETQYKYELDTDEKDIAFKMIRDNATEVLRQLDAIRKNPQKFVCLNDNVDHRKKSAVDVVAALHNFYEAFFPIRSQFELPVGFRNRFLHVSELRAWRDEQARTLTLARTGLIVLAVAVMLYMFWGKIRQLRRYLFASRHRQVAARV